MISLGPFPSKRSTLPAKSPSVNVNVISFSIIWYFPLPMRFEFSNQENSTASKDMDIFTSLPFPSKVPNARSAKYVILDLSFF